MTAPVLTSTRWTTFFSGGGLTGEATGVVGLLGVCLTFVRVDSLSGALNLLVLFFSLTGDGGGGTGAGGGVGVGAGARGWDSLKQW